ncbi:C2 domain-containing protein [Achromobacter aloeverae]|uniref:Lipoprotein n=1 Tax=Achromobacter aloeverae TaxID=1750518 RepID=A0A4Q1HPY5_9BURK|nr:hypothetical protein [Achromobacter aloeverae]RXN92741.1 hypothetical protein C7R54_03060 [Achromobacter aloeverae]
MIQARRILYSALSAALLAGCASAPPAPVATADLHLPRWVRVHISKPGQPDEDAMLAVQAEGQGATRWLLYDPIGMPRARQVLQDGKWRNDGFMRPNGKASDMFSAILFAWTPEPSLASAYAGKDWHSQPTPTGGRTRILDEDCSPRWQVTWTANAPDDTFSIRQPDGTTLDISPLKNAP